jgi:hypothetical protein
VSFSSGTLNSVKASFTVVSPLNVRSELNMTELELASPRNPVGT